MARVLSVNVGLPRDIAWKGYTVHTGVWKHPVRGRCRVGRLNLQGDGQGDLAGHGGEHRAVFVYQIESYRYWQEQLERTDFVDGQFGQRGWSAYHGGERVGFSWRFGLEREHSRVG
jgi:MOSC domain-containing protein YiiM